MKQSKLKGNFSVENVRADIHRLKCFLKSDSTTYISGIQLLADKYNTKVARSGGAYFKSTKLCVDEKALKIIKNDELFNLSKELKPVR